MSKTNICGARVSDKELVFLACARALDCVGGTSCGCATHKTGGKVVKRCQVPKMDLPEGGVKAFAIPVKSLGSAVECPKIFSLPILPKALQDYQVQRPPLRRSRYPLLKVQRVDMILKTSLGMYLKGTDDLLLPLRVLKT